MVKSKYKNKKTVRVLNGKVIEFDSLKEAKRFDELYLLLRAKKISNLVIQPEYVLVKAQKHNGKTFRAVKYISDFRYIQDGKTIVEDVKGYKTDVYQVKVKVFLSIYGEKITFKEI